MTKKQALGRGFDSLIPTNFELDNVTEPGEHVKNMEINKVVPNPYQPRKHFDEQALKELSLSIKEHGIIQPLVVTPYKDSFRIVAGERRYRAAKLIKLKKVPVIVRDHEELEELEIALVENVQRVDLSPIEQAVSIAKLRDQFSLSLKEISQKLGKAETTISNSARLIQLPNEAVEALQKNQISEGHARAILALKTDKDGQKILLNNIIVHKWSVRQSEDFVQARKVNKKSMQKTTNSSKIIVAKIDKSITKLVSVHEKNKSSGYVKLTYKNQSDLERIIKKLK